MVDIAPALKPGEVNLNVEELGAGDHAAADQLAQLFLAEDKANEIAPEAGKAPTPDDAGPLETAATREDEEGHSEPPLTGAAIEPPTSWTAEERQQFEALPPDAKKAIEPFIRRDRERDALLSTQGRKSADEAQRLTTMRQAVENERAQQTQLFQSVIFQLSPELQRFQSIDWQKLSVENPAEWAKNFQAYQDVKGRMDAAQSHINVLTQQQQQELNRQRNEFAEAEMPRLVQKFPDIADPVKAKAFGADLSKFIPEVQPDEWKGLIDHRYVLIARDAMLYRKAVAARAEARAKQVPANQSNVRPLRPGARPAGADGDAATARLKALHGTLGKTNSTEAAVNLLTEVFR